MLAVTVLSIDEARGRISLALDISSQAMKLNSNLQSSEFHNYSTNKKRKSEESGNISLKHNSNGPLFKKSDIQTYKKMTK